MLILYLYFIVETVHIRLFKRYCFGLTVTLLLIIIFSRYFPLEGCSLKKYVISTNMDLVFTKKSNRFQSNYKSIANLHMVTGHREQPVSITAEIAPRLSTVDNYSLNFERRVNCNFQTPNNCHTTNKSLVITSWGYRSKKHWLPWNMLSVFPEKHFEYIVVIHDNSTWNQHPNYNKIIWIHVDRQLGYWYFKRFLSPHTLRAYRYIWIVDDDISFNFSTRVYECVLDKFKIPLSSPAREQGKISIKITKRALNYTSRVGRWTDYVEIGPLLVAQRLAAICIWNYLSESGGSGYGLDLIWCKLLSARCFQQRSVSKICAILDAFSTNHHSPRINSLRNGLLERQLYQHYYLNYSSKQLVFGPVASDRSSLRDCEEQLSITA